LAENKIINIYKKKVHKENYTKSVSNIEYHTIEKGIFARDREEMVNFFMGQLDVKCRELLTDFYFKDMSLKDIAKKRGFNNDDVAKNIKSRCFGRLQEIILKTNVKELKDLINI